MARGMPQNNTHDEKIRQLVLEGANARTIYMFLNLNNRVAGKPDVISYSTVYRRYIKYVKIYRPWTLQLLPHEELFRTKKKTPLKEQ